MGMTEEIRAAVEARLKEKGMTRADLARAVSAQPAHITRALNDTGGRGGKIPDLWAAILEALDLRLTVEAGAPPHGEGKKSAPPPAEEKGQRDALEEWGEV